MFDRTDFGASNLSLPDGKCRDNDEVIARDCTAHSLLYDISSNTYRALMVQTNVWCSSGGLDPNGTLIQTGGYHGGDRRIRTFTPCNDDLCDWVELEQNLTIQRWYSSDHILPDGRFIIRSIVLDYQNDRVLREFPPIPGEKKSYPATGSSVMLPLRLTRDSFPEVEILVCGGNKGGAYLKAEKTHDLLMRMTLDSICKVGFGVEIGTLAPNLPENRFAKAFDAANIIVTLRFIDPLWKIKKFLNVGSEAILDQSIRTIDDFTYAVIRKRKAEIEETQKTEKSMKHDILSKFIELGKDPENNMNDKSLRDIVLNFVIAGRDTTATTLSWAIYMIMTHEDVAEKLRSELESVEEMRAKEENVSLHQYNSDDPESLNKSAIQFAGLLNYDTLAKLYYLHSVVTETLRLYPAVPQDPKGILEDDVLPDGTRVKAGGMVTYVPYSMGRMEYNWGPDADSFKPERWLKDGAGPRICLGKDSAYLQMKMPLAILCRFFKFKLVEGHSVEYRMMTVLSMAHGLKLTVSPRTNNPA
nr:cytochrome P450 704B1 [Ipomoea batatas]